MSKKLKLLLPIGLVAMTSFTFIGCSENTQKNKENNNPIISTDGNSNVDISNNNSNLSTDSTTKRVSYVRVDMGAGEGDGKYIDYVRDEVEIRLATVSVYDDIYEYEDYYVTVEERRWIPNENGDYTAIKSLILVNKYTAEVEEYEIGYDYNHNIDVNDLYIVDLDKTTGKITITSSDLDYKEGYIFDIESRTFSDKIKLDI